MQVLRVRAARGLRGEAAALAGALGGLVRTRICISRMGRPLDTCISPCAQVRVALGALVGARAAALAEAAERMWALSPRIGAAAAGAAGAAAGAAAAAAAAAGSDVWPAGLYALCAAFRRSPCAPLGADATALLVADDDDVGGASGEGGEVALVSDTGIVRAARGCALWRSWTTGTTTYARAAAYENAFPAWAAASTHACPHARARARIRICVSRTGRSHSTYASCDRVHTHMAFLYGPPIRHMNMPMRAGTGTSPTRRARGRTSMPRSTARPSAARAA